MNKRLIYPKNKGLLRIFSQKIHFGTVFWLGFVSGLLALRAAEPLDFSLLRELVVQEGGRKKAFYTFAYEQVLGMTGRTELVVDGQRMQAEELVLRMWLGDRDWSKVPMILVGDVALRQTCGFDRKKKLYSYEELTSNQPLLDRIAEAAAQRARDSRTPLRGQLREASLVAMRLAEFEGITNGSLLRIVPTASGNWAPLQPDQPEFQRMRDSLLRNDSTGFAFALQELRGRLAATLPEQHPAAWKIAIEVAYLLVHPFRWAWIFFGAAAVVLAATSLHWREHGYAIGMAMAIAGAVAMLCGFLARIAISGRAPVTNMYESIVWVAFGTVSFALLFEAIYRSRYFVLGASPVAVASLMVADAAPLKFDPTISPLVPVLQSNFWLTTHVLTITLGYAAFALALGIAHIVVGKVIFGRKPLELLYVSIYRCLQVGVLLLAAGTLLGAVWANYSWGRFWDWDPKETWALIALLSYLFLLHGRIAGKWKGFGLAIGSILCFQTILMAWYGVNFVLGAGLHSYGFGSGGLGWAISYVVLEFLLVAVALWRYHSLWKIPSPDQNIQKSASLPPQPARVPAESKS